MDEPKRVVANLPLSLFGPFHLLHGGAAAAVGARGQGEVGREHHANLCHVAHLAHGRVERRLVKWLIRAHGVKHEAAAAAALGAVERRATCRTDCRQRALENGEDGRLVENDGRPAGHQVEILVASKGLRQCAASAQNRLFLRGGELVELPYGSVVCVRRGVHEAKLLELRLDGVHAKQARQRRKDQQRFARDAPSLLRAQCTQRAHIV